jgi:ABC-type branched-subunit amino acid transport system substrate-binding protein
LRDNGESGIFSNVKQEFSKKLFLKEGTMKTGRSLFVIVCLLSVSLFFLSSSLMQEARAEVKTLTVGLITSVTGPMAPAFKPMYDAVKPTEDLINQRGGITVAGQKYNIKIVAEDDQSSPPGAIAAANRLIQQGINSCT